MNRFQAFGVGAATITEWLGVEGVPVAPELAAQRARACTAGEDGKPCRYNQPGNWWDRMAAGAATAVMAQTRAKAALGIKAAGEEQLHFCNLCHCRLELKVQVPFEVIAAYTPEKLWGELPKWCWMLQERQK